MQQVVVTKRRALLSTRLLGVAVIVGLLAGLSSCDRSGVEAPPVVESDTARRATDHYADVVYANYFAITDLAERMDSAVQAFVAAPSREGLERCREAWIFARGPYQQSEVFRFYGGPIDHPETGPEGDLNPWPLDEVYIDFVVGSPDAGIVQASGEFPELTEELLRALNGKNGEVNIATGWHAVEFLLWGEDRSADGPGQRSHEDFVDGKRPHADRRRQYLQLVSQMIVKDVTGLRDAWHPEKGDYRREFLKAGPKKGLTRMLTGLGTLAIGELRGERLVTPFLSKLQEDEHSCFSDQTHRDHLNNAIGIRNVWLARYGSIKTGTGLRDVVALHDSALAEKIDQTIEDIIQAFSSPAIEPFDQAILGADDSPGRQALQKALDALAALDRDLTAVAKGLNLRIVTSLPG